MYELDLRPALSPEEAIGMFPFEDEHADAASYAKSLVLSTAGHADDIDELLREHIVGWRTERMVAVDRAAIRIALCEGLMDRSVPVAVAISEAVELTKTFGTVESSRFVNGVLGRIVRSVSGSPEDAEGPEGSEKPPQGEEAGGDV
jgi:N utilization substance protein B